LLDATIYEVTCTNQDEGTGKADWHIKWGPLSAPGTFYIYDATGQDFTHLVADFLASPTASDYDFAGLS